MFLNEERPHNPIPNASCAPVTTVCPSDRLLGLGHVCPFLASASLDAEELNTAVTAPEKKKWKRKHGEETVMLEYKMNLSIDAGKGQNVGRKQGTPSSGKLG